jgi:hypothetical protein
MRYDFLYIFRETKLLTLKSNIMLRGMSRPKGGALLLAGLAAFVYYKYSRMSDEEKRRIATNLKEKGRNLYDRYVPVNIKSMFGNA